MIESVNTMDKEYINGLINYLAQRRLKYCGIKEIAYGVQVMFRDEERKEYAVRVYQNKKGRITLDASQIKDDNIKATVLTYTNDDTPYAMVSPPLIGSDEAGKGDYFGPLCVCAFYADEEIYARLRDINVRDSKTINDRQIHVLSEKIKLITDKYSIVKIGNAKFNELYAKTGNINAIMGWAHATAIKNVLKTVECKNVLTDKYGSEHWLIKHMGATNTFVTQLPKAEQNLAVAAASILARDAFVENLSALGSKYGAKLPLGAGSFTDDAAVELVLKHGEKILHDIAKISFKNTERILKRVKDYG